MGRILYENDKGKQCEICSQIYTIDEKPVDVVRTNKIKLFKCENCIKETSDETSIGK